MKDSGGFYSKNNSFSVVIQKYAIYKAIKFQKTWHLVNSNSSRKYHYRAVSAPDKRLAQDKASITIFVKRQKFWKKKQKAEKLLYKGLKQLYNKKFRLHFQNNISAIL